MDYTSSVVVPGGREQIAAMFTDTTTWKAWQPTFLTAEVLDQAASGGPVQSRLAFQRGRGEMVMTETVLDAALPDHWNVTYETSGVHNLCETRFVANDDGTTTIEQRNVFRFTGFMRVVGALFGKSFPAETQKTLEAFRDYVISRSGG